MPYPVLLSTTGMAENTARGALGAVVEAAVAAIAARGRPIEDWRGIAGYDFSKDKVFRALDSFTPAVAAVSALPLMKERFGADEGARLVLQFIFEFLNRVERLTFVVDAFDDLWSAFERELSEPNWTYRAVANMRCFRTAGPEGDGSTLFFRSTPPPIVVADGVTIRGRTVEDLSALGFDKWVLAQAADHWEQDAFGATSFVMVVEDRVAKTPQNLVSINTPDLRLRAQRAIGALRLVAPGDVGIGPMWIVRASHFPIIGHSGWQFGFTVPLMGSQYVWTAELESAVRAVYSELEWLEANGYGKAPGNLDLALRSFMATYDRWPTGADSRLLDSVTALEALLSFGGTEITFKLAFRVASLLAKDDAERGAMFEEIRGFYATRSALVHGDRIGDKHQQALSKVDDLRSLVRRLLRSFVHLAARGTDGHTSQSFKDHLDAKLVNASERETLRRALGLA